jgi:hypothetical protein
MRYVNELMNDQISVIMKRLKKKQSMVRWWIRCIFLSILEREYNRITRLLVRHPFRNSGFIPTILPLLAVLGIMLHAEYNAFCSQGTLVPNVKPLEAVRVICTCFGAVFYRSNIRHGFVCRYIIPVFEMAGYGIRHQTLEEF